MRHVIAIELAWRMVRRRPVRSLLFLAQLTICFAMCALAVSYVVQARAVARLPYQILGPNTLGTYFSVADHDRRPDFTGVSPEQLPRILELPGVEDVAVALAFSGVTDTGHPVDVVVINDGYGRLSGAGLEFSDWEAPVAFATRSLARRLRLVPGDRAVVLLHGGRQLSTVVEGIVAPLAIPPRFGFRWNIGEFDAPVHGLIVRLEDLEMQVDISPGLWVIAEEGAVETAGLALTGWWQEQYSDSGLSLEWFSVADACQELIESSRIIMLALAPPAVLLLVLAGAGFIGTSMLNTEGRRVELAVRRALGATVGQIGWQLAMESLLLVIPAAVVATAIAVPVTLVTSAGARAPAAVLFAAGGLSLVLALICGAAGTLYPLYRVGREQPAHTLKQEA